MQVNLLLLMAVSFLPFPTRLLAEAIRDPDAERTAVIFYGGCLLVIQILIACDVDRGAHAIAHCCSPR